MRTIIHLSDLHFGRTRPDLLNPPIAMVNGAAPDLVVVSGDLTQRARVRQFQEAQAFLDRIEALCVVVPGNHDTPLDNIPLRLFGPWHRYRSWIGEELEPGLQDDELSVVGVNTVNPLNWQRGRINRRRVARICAALGGPEAGRTRIVVAHHPFAHTPEKRDRALMHGAGRVLGAHARCGADIVLSGHLHAWRAEPSGPATGKPPGCCWCRPGRGCPRACAARRTTSTCCTCSPARSRLSVSQHRTERPAIGRPGARASCAGPRDGSRRPGEASHRASP